MKITYWDRIPAPYLLNKIEEVKLLKSDTPRSEFPIYKMANTKAIWHGSDPYLPNPCQNYLLNSKLSKIYEIYNGFLDIGLDLFNGDCQSFWFRHDRMSDDEPMIPFIPPVVEHDTDGSLLLCDGMHRTTVAKELGKKIAFIVIGQLPAEFPYYAHQLEGGWSSVVKVDTVPDQKDKKKYRYPEQAYSYFRDFNAVFPGIQELR